jgi:cytochrome c553
MKRIVTVLTIVVVLAIATGIVTAQQTNRNSNNVPPPWAYGFATSLDPSAPVVPSPAPAATNPAAGATNRSPCQTDMFPDDHPQMPGIVHCGRPEANIVACSLCHYPNGKGRAENAPVAGLPESYFIQTMMDFKNDLRKSADGRKGNTGRMAGFAKAMTDEEIRASAKYFSSLKWTSWIRVVETDTVPKTRIANGLFLALEGAEAGKEPIGQRIIEVPENTEQTERLRNPHSGFIAYVPPGSIKKGQAIVTTGANKTVQCAVCHGADLQGMGPVPGIAGRSPSYMVRQLFDMQQGTRKASGANS